MAGHKLLLIVEDDPLIARLYEKIFKFEGYDVTVAHDGQEGFEKSQVEPPTLILLDIMMPKMNGLDVLKKLKASEATKNIPVIMLTNLAGQRDAETALLLGAVKYIVKSDYTPKQIAEIVKEILAGYTRDAVPANPQPQTPPTTPS